jgi:hypothetical protein
VFTQTIPGCGGVWAAAVVAVDFGFDVLSFEAVLLDLAAGAEEFPPVTVNDWGAAGALGDAAGCAAALSLAALDLRDFLLGAGSVAAAVDEVVAVAGCADEASLGALDFLDFLAGASVVPALAVVAVASVDAFAFFDFLVDFFSVVLASAVVPDFESSAALAFFDFFDFVVLLSSVLVEAAVL